MNAQEIISQMTKYSQSNPKEFWIITIIILLFLYFIFKNKNKGTANPTGLNPFQLEVFKRKNK